MNSVNVTVRVDKDLKNQADKLFKELGLTLNSAFNIYLKQAVREQKIPFEIAVKSELDCPTNEKLDNLFDKELEKHLGAYKELAK